MKAFLQCLFRIPIRQLFQRKFNSSLEIATALYWEYQFSLSNSLFIISDDKKRHPTTPEV